MGDKDTGGPAFPGAWREDVNDGFISGSESGMTLRDYFAASERTPEISKQLAEALAGPSPEDIGIEYARWIAKWQSKWKYINADAMLKAREE